MKDLFNGQPLVLEGKNKGISMSRVELIKLFYAIRSNPKVLVTYDKDEEEWKETPKQVNTIREMFQDNDKVTVDDKSRRRN